MKAKSTTTPETAFIDALTDLVEDGNWEGEKKEIRNYIVEVENPQEVAELRDKIVESLNEFHDDPDHFDTVSQWTFPKQTNTGLTGEISASDEDGEYFRRLIESEKGNQLESMVEKIEKWGRNNRTVAQVFQVDRDLKAMFPPCLLDIQVFYRGGDIHLTGHYRSHTVCKSYYGDIVSLGRLQNWLAERTDSGIGTITVHSGSLHIRKKNNEHELAQEMYEDYVA